MGGSGRILAALLTLVVVGCGGGDGGAASRTTVTLADRQRTTTTVAATTTVPSFGQDPALVQQVWADYEAAIDAIEAAVQHPDPNDPTLAEHLSGPMLQYWQRKLGEMAGAGQAASYPFPSVSHVALLAIRVPDSSTAELDVCSTDDAIIRDASGAVLNDEITTVRFTEYMEMGDRWRLAERVEGEGSCDASP